MALPASGAISFNAVNTELKRTATQQLDINTADARSLAAVASGAISLSNFYGKAWWTYTTGTIGSCSGSSSGADFTGGSVAIGRNIKATSVYITLTYSWDGTGTTTYGAAIQGYEVSTSTWFDLGVIASEILRPATKTLSGTVTVSAANQARIISHVRVTGWGGLYCTSRSVSASVKGWYQQ